MTTRAMQSIDQNMRPDQNGRGTAEEISKKRKPIVLVFCDFFLPGYKSGGGMRTLVNTIERLGDDFDFRVVTRDHDGKTDKTPYSNIKIDEWNQVGKAAVRYLSGKQIRFKKVKGVIEEVGPDSIYLNSYFSTFTVLVLLLRKLGTIKRYPIIIAPEGELSTGGLQLKKTKKKLYQKAVSTVDLYNGVIWKAASQLEADEAKKIKGSGGAVFVAPNMSPKEILKDYSQGRKRTKIAGAVNLVYLSRIHPIKNLAFLLELLETIEGDVQLDIYGPVDDNNDYLDSCHRRINTLPQNVKVDLKGEIEHQKVAETLFNYDFFVLPTLSENFGHVFVEALSAGCPLITSDRTPWIDLEKKGVGWDIPLHDREKWTDVLDKCVQMDGETFSRISCDARRHAELWLANDEIENATRKVIEYSLSNEIITEV